MSWDKEKTKKKQPKPSCLPGRFGRLAGVPPAARNGSILIVYIPEGKHESAKLWCMDFQFFKSWTSFGCCGWWLNSGRQKTLAAWAKTPYVFGNICAAFFNWWCEEWLIFSLGTIVAGRGFKWCFQIYIIFVYRASRVSKTSFAYLYLIFNTIWNAWAA